MTSGRIGVFDSGVGGLTVLQALERRLPGARFVYLGDTARVPYGTRSADTVRRYALEAWSFFESQSVSLLVVACNTVSSVALDALRSRASVPVVGVIEPGARAAAVKSRTGRIGVIGTRATIASGAYARAIRAARPDAAVVERACPLFVPLAEEGWTDHPVTRQVAEAYLAPLREQGVDTLVLGCTHYPILRDVLHETMGGGVVLVDSAESVAAEVVERVRGGGAAGAAGGSDEALAFHVTDAPDAFRAVAERFLGHPLPGLHRTELPHLPA